MKKSNNSILMPIINIFKYFFVGLKTVVMMIIKPIEFVVTNFINGFIVLSYWFYKVVITPIWATKQVVTMAEKVADDKITVKEYNAYKNKMSKDIKTSKKESLDEVKNAKKEAKRKIEEEKRKKKLAEELQRKEELEEKRQKILAEKEQKKIKKQKEKVNKKSKADIRMEKHLAKKKKIEKAKLDKLEAARKKEQSKQERKKQKMLARIEARTNRILNKEQAEKDKQFAIIDKKIQLVTDNINDINNMLKNQGLPEKQKGDLALKRSRLEEELLKLKARRKEIEEKITAKYEKIKNKEALRAQKEKDRFDAMFNKEAYRLKKQNEKEKKFIEAMSKKKKVNKKDELNKAIKPAGDAKEEEKPKEKLNFFQKLFKNSIFGKEAEKKREVSKQALLLNLDTEETAKSDVKIVYEYVAKNPEGKVVKDYFEAFSKIEVHSYLLSEGYTVYSIRTNKWIQLFHSNNGKAKSVRVKMSDIIFMCTQLSTYIKAGIPLVEAIRILSKQYKKKSYQRLFSALMYDLTMGDNFSDALAKQGTSFPKLLINMVKASELTGELPEALDDMADYFTNTEATKKQMVTAMMYPMIVSVIALSVMIFVMMYVIPKFVDIYNSMEGIEIPRFTLAIIALSNWLKANIIVLLLGIALGVALIMYLYKNVKVIRNGMQWFAMHLPVFGNVIMYNEVTMFTKTFASLLKHNVFITDSMEILSKISNNEIYKGLIMDTITNLAKGEKISEAFKDQWAFPVAAYEMIVTGEKTGQLAEMMDKVAAYYQELHRNAVGRIKTFIEPIMIIGLTVATGVIVLAVIIPMFNMYSSLSALSSTTS